jgi:hypothetical protein
MWFSQTELLRSDVLESKSITSIQKRVLSFIRERQRRPLSGSYIAEALHLSRSVIVSGIARLEKLHMIRRNGRNRQGINYLFTYRHIANNDYFLKLPFPIPGLTSSEMILLCYLAFRQGVKGCAWPKQSTIADDLGFKNRSQISRLTAALANEGYLKVKTAHGGVKQSSLYYVNDSIFNPAGFDLLCGASPESRVQNRSQLITSLKNRKLNKDTAPDGGLKGNAARGGEAKKQLSAVAKSIQKQQSQEKFNYLLRAGIKPDTAREFAKNPNLTLASVENAILNGMEKERQSQGAWMLKAGYIIATLNKSLNNCNPVLKSKQRQAHDQKLDKELQLLNTPNLTPDQFEKRKQFLAAQLSAE